MLLTCCDNARLLSLDKKNIAVNLFSKLGWELDFSIRDFHQGRYKRCGMAASSII